MSMNKNIGRVCTCPHNYVPVVISQVKVMKVTCLADQSPLQVSPHAQCRCQAYSHFHTNALHWQSLTPEYSRCQMVAWATGIKIEQRGKFHHCCCCGNEARTGSDLSDGQIQYTLISLDFFFVFDQRKAHRWFIHLM